MAVPIAISAFNQLWLYASSPGTGPLLRRTRRFFPSGDLDHRQYSLCLPTEGWPGWLWLNTKMVYPRRVTHLSTNRARRRATIRWSECGNILPPHTYVYILSRSSNAFILCNPERFDLKIGSRITRVMVFHPANFELRPFRSRVRLRHATDRQTDRQTADRQTDTAQHLVNFPSYTEVGA